MDNNYNQLSQIQIRINHLLNESNSPLAIKKFFISIIFHGIIFNILFFFLISTKVNKNINTNNKSFEIVNNFKSEKNLLNDVDIIMNNKDLNSFRKLDNNKEILVKLEKAMNFSEGDDIEKEIKKYLKSLIDSLDKELNSFNNYLNPSFSKETIYKQKEKEFFLSRLTNFSTSFKGTWEFFPYNSSSAEENEDEFGKYYTNNNSSEKTSLNELFYIISSKNNFTIGNAQNGSVTLNFKKATEISTKKEALALNMKNLEDNYIDNWISHVSYIKLENLRKSIDLNRKKYYFSGEFNTNIKKGQFFNINTFSGNKQSQCPTLIEAEFPLAQISLYLIYYNKTEPAKVIYTLNPSNISMIISSTCGFRIKIKAEKHAAFEETMEENNILKVKKFFFMNIIIYLLYFIISIWISCYIDRHQYAINSFSVLCLSQNIAWHSYTALSFINLGIMNPQFSGTFILLSLFPLINFIVFDMRFLFIYWKVNKRILSSREFIKLRFSFFIIFYVFLIVSFLTLNSFFFDKNMIVISTISLWIPQILHNIRKYNKYIYPLIYIIIVTADRISIPIYFKLNSNNFLDIKQDINFVIFISEIIMGSIILLYLQVFLGPRFMLCKRFQKKEVNYHKTKAQILKEKPDSENDECVICLNPLFISELNDINNKSNNDNISKEINNNISFEEKKDNNININRKEFNNNGNNKSMEKVNIIENLKKKKLNEKVNLYKYKVNPIIIKDSFKSKKKKKNDNKCFLTNILTIIKTIFLENFLFFYKYDRNKKNQKYMLIGCGHAFHASCLEKWFEYKKECPSCRAPMNNIIF